MLDVMDQASASSGAQGGVLEAEAGSQSGPGAESSSTPTEGGGPAWRRPSVNSVVVLLLLIVGVRVGLMPLHDNSFLTHLATGRLIFSRGGVPHADPYSFSAYGHAWTVQSWGASVIYAGLEKVVGLIGIRIFDTLLTTSLVLLLWRLTRPAQGLLARAVPAGVVVCMGTSLWVERPLLIGAVALALVLLAAEDGLDPRWLVPIMWIWVNTHGSFPFGVGLLALLVAGRWLDERSRPLVELRALGWAVVGTVAGALNPVGWRMLLFPIELLSNREAFKRVAEWEPPHFHRGVELFFAAQLVAAVLLIIFRHRRWRAILPLVVFGTMALLSTRNILPASIVLTPIIAVAASGLGQIDGRRRPRLIRPVAVAVALLLVLVGISGLANPDTILSAYPQRSAAWMRSEGLLDVNDRVVTRDWVGNYLEFKYGPDKVRVFMDDRVDMYPLAVIHRFSSLLDQRTDYQAVLDHARATGVLWERRSPLGRWLVTAPGWKIVHRDARWLVAVPQP